MNAALSRRPEFTQFPPELIRASAGSGKTFALSTRYLKLLASGLSPEKILATTFTRKAAAEIYERVLTRLALAAQSPSEAAELSRHVGKNINSAAAQALLGRLIAQQHRLLICTFDSFFVGIAANFSAELGLPETWGVVDSQQTALLQQQAVGALCARNTDGAVSQLVYLLNKGESRRSVQAKLESSLSELLDLFRISSEEAWQWLQAPPKLAAADLASAIAKLETVKAPEAKSTKRPNQNWVKALAEHLESARTNNWELFLGKGIAAKLTDQSQPRTFSSQPIDDEVADIFLPLIRHSAAVFLNQLAQQNAALYRLLRAYAEELDMRQNRTGQLDFADVNFRLWRAGILGDLGALYHRLDSRISHILFDEFQDTSATQWYVLEPLVEELLSKADGEYSFFCVGDAKQAIYGWRGGVAEIFDSLETRFPVLTGHCTALSKSYRSSQVVLDAVNQVFGGLASNSVLHKYPLVTEHWAKRFVPHTTALTELSGRVEMIAVDQMEDPDGCLVTAARYAAELHRRSPQASIAILVRENKDVETLVRMMASPSIGIVASAEGGNALTDSPAVALIMSLLRLLDHPGDTVLRFAVANSPLTELIGLSRTSNQLTPTEQCFLEKLREELSREGLAPFLRRAASLLASSYAPRDARRLEQLVEAAARFDPRRLTRLSAFADWVATTKVEDPLAAPVRVMTIHKSKGLEFDAVLLPTLGGSLLGKPPRTLSYRATPLSPPEKVSRYADAVVRSCSPELRDMYEQYEQRALSEQLSILYVAMTRARQSLVLVVPAGKPKEAVSAANLLRASFAVTEQPESGLIYASGDARWEAPLAQTPAPTPPPLQIRTTEALFSTAQSAQIRRVPRIRPSDAFADQRQHRLSSLESSTARRRGDLFHRILQRLEWSTEFSPATLNFLLNSDDTIAAQELATLLAQPSIQQLFDRQSYTDCEHSKLEVFRELRFSMCAEGGVMSGSIDRLVLIKEAGKISRAEIIDFKSDWEQVIHRDLEKRVTRYTPQMNAYRRAVCKFTGLAENAVSVKLAFLSAGEVIKV